MTVSMIEQEIGIGWNCLELGGKFYQAGDFLQAISYYKMAAEIVSKYREPLEPPTKEVRESGVNLEKLELLLVKSYVGMGKSLYFSKEYDEAIKCFDKVMYLGSYRNDIIDIKARSLTGLGRYEDALRCYNESEQVKDDPYLNPDLLYNKTIILFSLKRYTEVIPCVDIVIESAIHHEMNELLASAYYIKAKTLYLLNNTQEATSLFIKSAELGNSEAAEILNIHRS